MSVTPVFVDSFGHYTNFSQKYDIVSVDLPHILAAAKRSGAFGMAADSSSSSFAYVGKNIAGSPASLVAGIACQFTSGNNLNRSIISFYDGGTNQISICVDVTGFIKAFRGGSGGTLLGTSAAAVTLGNYNFFEANVTIHGSTGTVNVWVNGVLALSLSGQNTSNSGANQITRVIFGSLEGSFGGVVPIYYADAYIGTVSSSSDHLGDVAVLCRFPSGNGSTNNFTATFAAFLNSHVYVVGETFKDSNNNVQRCTIGGTSASSGTPTWATTGGATTTSGGATFAVVGSGSNPGAQNWMAVSETPSDDNSSYVTDATAGHIDRYTYPSISGSQVFGVAVNIRVEKDDAGTRTVRAAVKSGATISDNGSDFALTLNTYAGFQGLLPTDPNTGVAWTAAGVSAAEFGIKTTT